MNCQDSSHEKILYMKIFWGLGMRSVRLNQYLWKKSLDWFACVPFVESM